MSITEQPAYPKGVVVGPCVCGSWPGGECLKCEWRPAYDDSYTRGVERDRALGIYRDTAPATPAMCSVCGADTKPPEFHPCTHLPYAHAPSIPSMSVATVNKVRAFEALNLAREQTPITTFHLIHAGMYARTITIPAGVVLTGALIKRATILIVNGDVNVGMGSGQGNFRLVGYHVLPASAHRKQAFLAHTDTQLTMLFPTDATDIEAVEDEFTDEADLLFSRHGENVVNITGE